MIDRYLAAFLLAIVLTASSQILLKVGARKAGDKLGRLYLNIYTLTAYATLAFVTLLTLFAYRAIPLKVGAMLSPLITLLVVFLSSWILRERLTRMQVLGAVVILFGVTIFNI